MAYVIPTLHPAHILRGAPFTDILCADLQKANRVSQFGHEQYENIVVAHPASPAGFENAVRLAGDWMDRWIALKCPTAVDVETSSLDYMGCRLYSVALSGQDECDAAVAFTLRDWQTLPWDAQAFLDGKLKQLLADENVPTIYHNAPFDYAVLTQHGFRINGQIWDTQGLHHIVQPDIPHDLGWVGHTYLDVEPWKLTHEGRKKATTDDVIELLVYNAKDALNTMKLLRPLTNEIANRGMSSLLMCYQMEFSKLAARMELRGIPVNMAKRKAKGEEFLRNIAKWLQEMRDYLCWPEFDPNKRRHVVEAVYSKPHDGRNCLGLDVLKETPTGESSTSYKALIDHIGHPFIRAFASYMEARTTYATQYKDGTDTIRGGAYARAIHKDGRLHPKWNPTGQKGSRFSSQPNVQNIASKHRDIFEAPPGRVFVGADKDQLELRIVACLAGVRELIDEMAKPDADPHRLAARNVYGDEFMKRTAEEQKKLRNMVKNVVYASIYNAGPQRVYETIREKKELDPAMRAAMTLGVVAHIHKSYFGRYVEIPVYHQRNYEMAISKGYNECQPLGRRRYFPVQPPPFTEIGNWTVQTTGSDFVGTEMVQIQYALDEKTHGDAQIIIHGHDALAVECRESDAEWVKQLVNQLFGRSKLIGPEGIVYLTSKAKIGKTLLDVK